MSLCSEGIRPGRRRSRRPLETAFRRVLRATRVLSSILLAMAVATNANSSASEFEILGVDVVPRNLDRAINDCWADAPEDAVVSCAPSTAERHDLTVTIELSTAASSDIVVEYASMDLTATAGSKVLRRAFEPFLEFVPGGDADAAQHRLGHLAEEGLDEVEPKRVLGGELEAVRHADSDAKRSVGTSAPSRK